MDSEQQKARFKKWMDRVDLDLIGECGLTHADIADQPWWDWFDSGLSAKEAANQALESEGFFEFTDEEWE